MEDSNMSEDDGAGDNRMVERKDEKERSQSKDNKEIKTENNRIIMENNVNSANVNLANVNLADVNSVNVNLADVNSVNVNSAGVNSTNINSTSVNSTSVNSASSSSTQNNTTDNTIDRDREEELNLIYETEFGINPSSQSLEDNNRNDSNTTWGIEESPCIEIVSNDSEQWIPTPAVLKKEKPKHNWFIVKEVLGRQLGGPSKLRPELFNSRCYGSLHCVQRLELMYKLEFHQGCVNSLNFNSDGSLLASGSDDLKVAIWDWKCGQKLLSFDTKHRGNVFQSKFLPLDGDLHIASCSRDGQVRLAQVSKQEGLRSSRKLGSHRGPCHKLAVLKDQPQVILSAGEDGIIFRHDLRNSKPVRVTHVEDLDREVALYSINSHPLNPNEFCVGGRDHLVRTYDQRNCGASVKPLKCYNPFESNDRLPYHVTCAVYNHNGSEILATYNDENIYLFDVNEGEHKYLHQYMGHRNGATIKGVNFFGPNSEFIVSGSDCGNVFFWDRNTEAIVQWFCADDHGVVNCLEPHPQVPYICTSGLDWDVKVWVPSYELEPEMKGLNETVLENVSAVSQWSYNPDMSAETLWVLWRRVSSFQRLPYDLGFRGWIDLSSDISSSSNNLDSDSNSDSGSDAQPGCTTS